MRIVITGGGTGGHVFPIVAIIRELKKLCQEKNIELSELIFIGPYDPSLSVIEGEDVLMKYIPSAKLRRYFSFKNIIDFFKLPIIFLLNLWYLLIYMPDMVFAKGGHGSLITGLVAWLYRIPVFIHESDVAPGLSNRILKRFATVIGISFEESSKFFPSSKTALVGNPVRKSLASPPQKKILRMEKTKPILLFLGGSQGAKPINDFLYSLLPDLLIDYQIIHQCGEKNLKECNEKTAKIITPENKDYLLSGFFNENELIEALFLSDIVISRAGSGNIFEIALTGKPSILIPLPNSSSNHQVKNAYAYASFGAATVIEQSNLTPHLFMEKLNIIMGNKDLIKQMSQAAKNFSKPEAAKKIAEEILQLTTNKKHAR